MQEFFNSFANWYSQLFAVLQSVSFRLYGYTVSLLSIIMAVFVIGFFVNIFWKGARK